MSSGQTVALVALLLVILGAPAGALAGAGAAAPAVDPASDGASAVAAPYLAAPTEAAPGLGDTPPAATNGSAEVGPPANTTYTVAIQPNGDARWRIATTFNLSSETEIQAFKELAAAFEAGETSSLGLGAFRRAAGLASAATGRQMSITNTLNASALPSSTPGDAALVLEFTWTNFGRVQNETVVVGDAFNTTDQWFEGLEANQQLRLRWPQGWTLVSSPQVRVENRSLVWQGPESFDRDDISATFGSNGGSGGTTTPTGTPPDERPAGLPWLPIGGLAVLVAAIVAFVVLRRRPDETPAAAAETDDEASADEVPGDADADEATTPAGGEEAAVAAEEAETDEDATEEDIDEELLSDEERIERLLEDNGGRMKQANIVKETGWSNAKVSQLLSAMDDADRIDKLRIGRENLISFPDEDVTDAEE